MSPVIERFVSFTFRHCVTTWANSTAEPSMWLSTCGSFHVQILPEGAVSLTKGFGAGGLMPRTRKDQENVVMPIWATFLTRSAFTRSTPNTSNTACAWAQCSICRAIIDERTDISGPAHFTRKSGSAVWNRSAISG